MTEFKQDETETLVVFRRWRKSQSINRDVFAIFPHDAASMDAHICGSYEHVGQHGGCDPRLCMRMSTPCNADDYKALQQELEGAPYGYRLKIRKRANWYDAQRVRQQQLDAIHKGSKPDAKQTTS